MLNLLTCLCPWCLKWTSDLCLCGQSLTLGCAPFLIQWQQGDWSSDPWDIETYWTTFWGYVGWGPWRLPEQEEGLTSRDPSPPLKEMDCSSPWISEHCSGRNFQQLWGIRTQLGVALPPHSFGATTKKGSPQWGDRCLMGYCSWGSWDTVVSPHPVTLASLLITSCNLEPRVFRAFVDFPSMDPKDINVWCT